MIKLQSQSTSNPTSIAQFAALEAMTGPMDTVTVMLAEYSRRRDRIVSGLRAIPGITCVEPGGAFYAFPSVAEHLGNGIADTATLAKLLLDKQHLVVVNLPAAADQDDHRQRVDPMHDAHRQRVQQRAITIC